MVVVVVVVVERVVIMAVIKGIEAVREDAKEEGTKK